MAAARARARSTAEMISVSHPAAPDPWGMKRGRVRVAVPVLRSVFGWCAKPGYQLDPGPASAGRHVPATVPRGSRPFWFRQLGPHREPGKAICVPSSCDSRAGVGRRRPCSPSPFDADGDLLHAPRWGRVPGSGPGLLRSPRSRKGRRPSRPSARRTRAQGANHCGRLRENPRRPPDGVSFYRAGGADRTRAGRKAQRRNELSAGPSGSEKMITGPAAGAYAHAPRITVPDGSPGRPKKDSMKAARTWVGVLSTLLVGSLLAIAAAAPHAVGGAPATTAALSHPACDLILQQSDGAEAFRKVPKGQNWSVRKKSQHGLESWKRRCWISKF